MKLRIITAVVDTQALILYTPEGDTIAIKQGDPRLAKIMKDITPILAANNIAVIDLDDYAEKEQNVYKTQEENSNGIVKFFKVAKSKILALFGKESKPEIPVAPPVPPTSVSIAFDENALVVDTYEESPTPDAKPIPESQTTPTAVQQMEKAVAEIMQHAVPAATPEFENPQLDETHEIVAVVDQQVITNVDAIQPQIKNADVLQNYAGITEFLKRVASVASKRRHSSDDLMRFMRRGDLPIADDGSIIIYKVLNRTKEKGVYVDIHSGKVHQKVGSYVCMDESLVDHDRSQECSNGLHVARRDYIHGFQGDVCVMAKVAPEDVIAVPQYDSNKMRVCGYHIIFEMSSEAHNLLRLKKPFTVDTEAQRMLGKAISGDHIGKIEEVRITGHKGAGVVIKSLMNDEAAIESAASNITTSLDKTAEVIPIDPIENVVDIVDPLKVIEEVEQLPTPVQLPEKKEEVIVEPPKEEPVAKPAQEPTKKTPLTRAEKAQKLYEQIKKSKGVERSLLATELLNFKSKAKVGWSSLGFTDDQVEKIKGYV